MIDLHSHLLVNIDDGSKSLEETINIIKEAYKNGVTKIVLTPHFIYDSIYNKNKASNQKLLNQLKKEIKKNNLAIDLYLGNEIYLDSNIIELLENNTISTINNTKYILIELPLNNKYHGFKEMIFKLQVKGYKIILAHPERYCFIKEDFNNLYELKELGLLFQCNIGSFFKNYGKESYKIVKKMAKNHLIDIISSDTHNAKHIFYKKLKKLKRKLRKWYKKEEIEDIFTNNPNKIIENQDLNHWLSNIFLLQSYCFLKGRESAYFLKALVMILRKIYL